MHVHLAPGYPYTVNDNVHMQTRHWVMVSLNKCKLSVLSGALFI